MAIIKPFKGVRPPQDLVEQVASRPYDVLNSEEARTEHLEMKNPFIISLSPRLTFLLVRMNTMNVFMRKLPKTSGCFRIKAG